MGKIVGNNRGREFWIVLGVGGFLRLGGCAGLTVVCLSLGLVFAFAEGEFDGGAGEIEVFAENAFEVADVSPVDKF